MKAKDVVVSTSEFEFSHGKAPKGFGNWFFHFGSFESGFWVRDTFSKAKSKARTVAAQRGQRVVNVGS